MNDDTEKKERAIELLCDSLSEAQSTVRSYDTKAQIVGIGYIFALGVIGRFCCVGDFRQTIYQTSHATKNPQSS